MQYLFLAHRTGRSSPSAQLLLSRLDMQKETHAAAAAKTIESQQRSSSSKKRRRSSKKLPRVETEPDPTVFDIDWLLVAELTTAATCSSSNTSSKKKACKKKYR